MKSKPKISHPRQKLQLAATAFETASNTAKTAKKTVQLAKAKFKAAKKAFKQAKKIAKKAGEAHQFAQEELKSHLKKTSRKQIGTSRAKKAAPVRSAVLKAAQQNQPTARLTIKSPSVSDLPIPAEILTTPPTVTPFP